MIKIWRVENEKGEGCYQGSDEQYIKRWITDRHNKDLKYRPTPLLDKKISRYPEEKEMADLIYDTLFKNLNHNQFPTSQTLFQQVDNTIISFEYQSKFYEIIVKIRKTPKIR